MYNKISITKHLKNLEVITGNYLRFMNTLDIVHLT